MQYAYPTYGIDLTREMMQRLCDNGIRLLHEVGFRVPHQGFLSRLRGKAGIRIDGERVHFEPSLTRRYLDAFIQRAAPPGPGGPSAVRKPEEWTVRTAGYSMMVLDVATEEIRPGTCQDLRDMIKLVNSFGVGGYYPVMPQDLPPLMRAIACFKICWEMSRNIEPFDYQQPEQTRYLYEMHRVMGKTFDVSLTVPTTMTIDPKDVDIFLSFYDDWKKNRDIRFGCLDYSMVGITKPITVPGCAMMVLAETLAVHMLFNLFDPEVNVPVGIGGGHPVDLRNACWAFGSPRAHVFRYLNSRLLPALTGHESGLYAPPSVALETSSPAMDEVAAMEKMAHGLLGALQGARTFDYAGVLCVDDVFSGTQFVMDFEMVRYIRETIESFNPHPDIIDMEGLYEECRDVSLGNDTFISHPNTVQRFRNIVPSSDRIVREKLRAWLVHRKLLKDRAKEEALERIKTFEPYHLPSDKQKELDKIYSRAETQLVK